MYITAPRRINGYLLGLMTLALLVSLLLSPLGAGLIGTPGSQISGKHGSLDFGLLPMSFEPTAGQVAGTASFGTHMGSSTLLFSPSEVVLAMPEPVQSAQTTPAVSGELESVSAADPRSLKKHLADVRSHIISIHFLGTDTDTDTTITNGPALYGKVNYFLGNDPNSWRTGLPTYSGITYSHLYPGIDLSYSGRGMQLKGTYTVAAGSDPGHIRWRYDGAKAVNLDSAGNLQVQITKGDAQGSAILITEQAPVAWQQIGSERVPVPVRYRLDADGSITFALHDQGPGSYNPAYPLTIDPTLTYSTFLGGSAMEKDYSGNSMVVDAQGYVYITGQTLSANFPTRDAYQSQYHGGVDYGDAFVVKLNPNAPPDQQLVYATYLGGGDLAGETPGVGPGDDVGESIGLDADGNIYVSGATSSLNFPLQNPYQPSYGGGEFDAFISKLNPSGSALIYSTYLGGNGWDDGIIAVDKTGEVYMGGNTSSNNLPTVNAFNPAFSGVYDTFVAKLDSAGSNLLYSTYLGGGSWDFSLDIELDASGKVYITGDTSSDNFPVHNAFQPTGGGSIGNQLNFDAFVSVLDLTAPPEQQLFYSTYLGGAIPAFQANNLDLSRSVAVDAKGDIYLAGTTGSLDFPVTPGAFQTVYGGGITDAFVSELYPNVPPSEQLIFSTYIGGNGVAFSFDTEGAMALALDGQGNIYLTGRTDSPNFPLQNPIQSTFTGIYYDAFVAKLNPQGSALLFSTFLGGHGSANGNTMVEQGSNIALDGAGHIYLLGQTDASDFPIQNGFQTTYGGGNLDAFIAIISEPPPGSPSPTPTSLSLTRTATATSLASSTTASPTRTAVPTNATTRTPTPTTVPPTPCPISFSDVPAGSTFYPYIRCLACRGIVSGYSDGTFRPNNNVTRGQLSKIVSNAAGFSDPPAQMFQDVPPGSTFYAYIGRLASRGYVNGYPCGGPGEPCVSPANLPYFRTNNNATRGQITKIVSNAAGFTDPPAGQLFEDVPPGSTFYTYSQRLASRGVMQGYQCGSIPNEPCIPPDNRPYFRPFNNATRGQTSKIVANTFFPDCDTPNALAARPMAP